VIFDGSGKLRQYVEITTYGCSLKRAMRMNKRVSETVAEIDESLRVGPQQHTEKTLKDS
jgi:hypothetical protein